MFATKSLETQKSAALFLPIQSELLEILDQKAEALTSRPEQLFPLTPSQVRSLLA